MFNIQLWFSNILHDQNGSSLNKNLIIITENTEKDFILYIRPKLMLILRHFFQKMMWNGTFLLLFIDEMLKKNRVIS